jgi:excisionase family DNA binding protein
MTATSGDPAPLMTVRQVAEYLNLNQKTVYALVSEGRIPGTKVTGKWTFPRELVDRWLLESSHGGLLTDRLVMVGAGDPLMSRLMLDLADHTRSSAVIAYTPTGTRLGLDLLAAHRADVCCIHWGPLAESELRHPALLKAHTRHRQWIVVRAFARQQGLMLTREWADEADTLEAVFARPLRWTLRQTNAGTSRFLQEVLSHHRLAEEDLQVAQRARSEREAAGHLNLGLADVAPGTQAAAREFGLGFIPAGWEALDLVLDKGVYFRTLFRHVLALLSRNHVQEAAQAFGGYDLAAAGKMIWSHG